MSTAKLARPAPHSIDSDLRELDARFAGMGLTRARRAGAETAAKSRRRGLPGREEPLQQDELRRLTTEPREVLIAANRVQWLAAPGWNRYGWLWHGFSTRKGGRSVVYSGGGQSGELNLGFTNADAAETVRQNRSLLTEAITGDAATPLMTIRQIHSNRVIVVGDQEDGAPEKADGLMTDQPGILIGVQTADCIPVLVADRKRKAVAAFHAGWRGTVRRIVEAGVGRMRMEFGSRPEDLIAAIGPGVGQCCYAVGDEVRAAFESQFEYSGDLFVEVDVTDPVRAKYAMMFLNQRAPGHGPRDAALHLDLVEANRRQLLAAGLNARAVKATGGCTSCRQDLFFSHRASGGHAGRMMSVIGVGLNAR
jgi:polyphenol oxidase